MLLAQLLVAALVGFAFGISSPSSPPLHYRKIGYGLQKLQHHKYLNQTVSSDCGNSESYFFKEAVIDNFAPIESQQHWSGDGQRYWINREFFKPGNPIFVFIGGEGQEYCTRLSNYLYFYDLAQMHGGLLVDIEHRFYGKSYPTPSMTTKELQYLSSNQALADLARLITKITHDFDCEGCKVITVGGSYPGSLAAWFRLKYPSISTGSIASSAPIAAELDFTQYMDVVAQSIEYFSGQSCLTAFETAAKEVARLIESGPGSSDWKKLAKDFQTCSPVIRTWDDMTILLSDLMGNIQETVQMNNILSYAMNITDICDIMEPAYATNVEKMYANFVSLSAAYRKENQLSCEDASWSDTVAYIGNTAMDPDNMWRPWMYQTCNEFGYFQTTGSKSQPFNSWKWLDLAFNEKLCSAAFDGWKAPPEVEWTNINYGGTDIMGTNIVFPHGSIDPWHALGITNTTLPPASQAETEEPVYIEGTAHCRDMYAPKDGDSVALVFARETIAENVAKWLQV